MCLNRLSCLNSKPEAPSPKPHQHVKHFKHGLMAMCSRGHVFSWPCVLWPETLLQSHDKLISKLTICTANSKIVIAKLQLTVIFTQYTGCKIKHVVSEAT